METLFILYIIKEIAIVASVWAILMGIEKYMKHRRAMSATDEE